MAEHVHARVVLYREPTDTIRLAVAGYLAGSSQLTRQVYALDLRTWVSWCERHGLDLFSVRRAHIELFARDLEAQGKARATIARRLSTIAGFYRYSEEEGVIEHSPATHVRRPKDRLRVTRRRA